jgi:chromosome segregation ATPase
MELNYSKIFNNTIVQAVSAYCKLNNIEDINGFMKKCFDSGFNIEKYGLLGKTLNDGEKDLKTDEIEEKQVIKEVIVEKRVEVPVEVIKEVEKIIEVPVEVVKEIVIEKEVIKEVPVEKIVTKIEYISDKTSENELVEKIDQLEENIFQLNQKLDEEKQLFSTKTTEMENNFQNEMSKKDKELDELRRNLDEKKNVTQNNDKSLMLQETLLKLRKDIVDKDKLIEELNTKLNNIENNINKGAVFMKGSNLTNNI